MKKALIQIHLAVLLWGFTGILGRAISLASPMLTWYRMLITALIIAVIITIRKQWVKVERRDFWQLALVGCLMGIHWVAFYGSIKLANASIAMVCLSTASVFTALLDPYINKSKKDFVEILLGLLALAGVYLVYQFQQLYGAGILLGIIAAILSATFTVLNKRFAAKYTARVMVFYEMSTGWIFITLLLPLQFYFLPGAQLIPRSPDLFGPAWYQNDWLWIVVISLCCTVWAQSLALNALKKLSSFTITLSVNMEPVYGILLAVLFYKENNDLSYGFYIGMGLICLSVVLQLLRVIKPSLSPGFLKERGGIEQ